MPRADVAVVGGGIVGLAAAWQLVRARPALRVVVLEKENQLAAHQTGRNSGVIHSGVYYKPGSMKARTCRHGKGLLERFCGEQGVPFEICGKVIVALDDRELPRLRAIEERGRASGVRLEAIGAERLREIEPHTSGIAALYVPEAGIVDYTRVCERLAALLRAQGSEVTTGARVSALVERGGTVVLTSTAGELESTLVVNCAGLHSDRLAVLAGDRPPAKIVPFRGEYFELLPAARHLCRNLIYPVPDPAFPFLGVHFTRMVAGGVECGPNAVLAFAREGYHKTTIDLRDLAESLTYPGFLRLAARPWRAGVGGMLRSLSKAAFVRALQRLVPEIRAEHLHPAPAGVRAQALLRDGSLVDDFMIREHGRVINVCNAPSPAATASLAIGEVIAARVVPRLA